MNSHFSHKSSTREIRERFDHDVARFSNLQTGQQSTLDAPLCLELLTDAAKAASPSAKHLLDIGCGAGNFSLKMLEKVSGLDCTLIDLSRPMLDKAKERVSSQTNGKITVLQQDIREAVFPENSFDIILAGAVFHHLRDEDDWAYVFSKLYKSLKPGGSLWISDLVVQDSLEVNKLIWEHYGNYLEKIGGEAYRKDVLAYIEKEDSPRSVNFQLELMKRIGFTQVEILHKNLCFAAFGGIK